jgi:hypothetical protein
VSLAFAFAPVFAYIGFALTGLILVARLLLHWALKE